MALTAEMFRLSVINDNVNFAVDWSVKIKQYFSVGQLAIIPHTVFSVPPNKTEQKRGIAFDPVL